MFRAPFFGVRPAGWIGGDPIAQMRDILEWAVKAEKLGFDVLFVGDRLLAEAHGSGPARRSPSTAALSESTDIS
jgi:alkanesulfonate monooxygenase SsuD/methylene tetrahydromethanopterin reductase-like flavin-dependent oxidoreductase (luciferase family)